MLKIGIGMALQATANFFLKVRNLPKNLASIGYQGFNYTLGGAGASIVYKARRFWNEATKPLDGNFLLSRGDDR